MHILFVCHEYPPMQHGGIGTFTQTLARGLVRAGHRVTVVGTYMSAASAQDDEGVRVVRLESKGPRGARAAIDARNLWKWIAKAVATDQVDVIDGPEMAFWGAPRSLSDRCAIRMNGGHHYFCASASKPVDPVRSRLELRSFKRVRHLSAVSHYVAEQTRNLLSLDSRRIEILYNLVDVERFRPNPTIRPTPGKILFVGTVTEKKGIRQLVEAMPYIREASPASHLVVAGRDTSDDHGQSFTARLKSAMDPAMQAYIEFLGAVPNDEVPQLLATAEVCAYPSHMEALPLAWIEAMAAGKALVASTTGPGPEVVEDQQSGLLCDPMDVPALAQAISSVINSSELRLRLEAGARERAITRFSSDRLIQHNIDWFRAISTADPVKRR